MISESDRAAAVYTITMDMINHLRQKIKDAGIPEEHHVKTVLAVMCYMTSTSIATAISNMDARQQLLDSLVEDCMEMP